MDAQQRIEEVVGRALQRVEAGSDAFIPATPAMPVGEIAAAVRRLGEERSLRVKMTIETTGIFLEPEDSQLTARPQP